MPRVVFEQKADPEGAHLRPVTPRESGRALIFIGGFLFFTALLTLAFVGWDIRGGHRLVQLAFAVQFIAGHALLVVGYSRKTRAPQGSR